jgi:murein DD-endopeptidase MepM/ murein hydrolase activator NlpD
MLHELLFPQLKEDVWEQLFLDAAAREWYPARKYPTNPLLDPRQFSAWLNFLKGVSWDHGYGGYLEDREHLWRGHYMKSGEKIHLGIDYAVPEGTHVHMPADALVVEVRRDIDQNGGWGGRVLCKLSNQDCYFVLAHLAHQELPDIHVFQTMRKGEFVGTIGSPQENGRWFPHLHVQCVSGTEMRASRGGFDGYAAPSESNRVSYPDPAKVLGNGYDPVTLSEEGAKIFEKVLDPNDSTGKPVRESSPATRREDITQTDL